MKWYVHQHVLKDRLKSAQIFSATFTGLISFYNLILWTSNTPTTYNKINQNNTELQELKLDENVSDYSVSASQVKESTNKNSWIK